MIFFPEGKLRPDTLESEQLYQYRRLILPECRYLTSRQANLLQEYLQQGGKVVIIGEPGLNLAAEQRQNLLGQPNVVRIGGPGERRLEMLPDGAQVHCSESENLALHIQRSSAGAAIHLIRYDYDPSLDAVPLLPELQLKVRLPQQYRTMTVYSPGPAPEGTLVTSGNHHHIQLNHVPLYCIILLT